jgi:two-component system, chemotaxis family, response regulator Rcp1
MDTQPITILLVEDSQEDVDLTKEALKESKLKVNLIVVTDGLQALNYLSDTENKRPDLVLLDLNLPKKNGLEVLTQIKGDERLKAIPVVIMTTSRSEEDVLRSYKNHANCYICKPLNLDKFIDVVRAIEDFWITIVKLPYVPRGGTYDS